MKGFIESKAYQTYLNKYTDKEKILTNDRNFFRSFGEETFLDSMLFDVYAIYLYRNRNDSLLNIYVLKEEQEEAEALHKILNENQSGSLRSNEHKDTSVHFSVRSKKELKDNESFNHIKVELASAVKNMKDLLPDNYDSPFRIIFYYDGQDFYRLSEYQLETPQLNKLDSLFRNSDLFR